MPVSLPATLFTERSFVGESPDAEHVGFVLAAFFARTPINAQIDGIVRIVRGHGQCFHVSSTIVESLSVTLTRFLNRVRKFVDLALDPPGNDRLDNERWQ